MKKLYYILPLVLVLAAGCRPQHYSIQNATAKNTRINTQDTATKADTSILKIIGPYKAFLDSTMQRVIGEADTELVNKRPNGNLGNFIADILKDETSKLIKRDVDFAFTNISGIRLPSVPPGPITVGRMFELLPFDNMVIAAEVSGATLKKALEKISSKGGEAVSGFEIVITKNGTLQEAYYKDSPVDFNRTYIICTNDFLFNGGDDYTMFKEGVVQVFPISTTIRDMVMQHINNMYKSNLTVKPAGDERIKIQ